MEFDGPEGPPPNYVAGAERPNLAARTDLAIEDDHGMGPSPAAEAFTPRHLSPSSANVYRQCARKWKFRYVDRMPDPPGEAALAGTFAHRVLELLLQYPAGQRSKDLAKKLARRAWPETAADPDFAALHLDEQQQRHFRWRGWLAVDGLWSLENPDEVEVHATEHDVQVDISGVPFRGIIDRVDIVDDELVVSDYKSGKAPSDRFKNEALAQVLMYAAALESLTGQRPTSARLLYLGQRILGIPVTAATLGEAVEGLQATWSSLCDDAQTGDFEPTTGPLCAWCPFVSACPEGQGEVRRRFSAGTVRADAPGLVVLAEAS